MGFEPTTLITQGKRLAGARTRPLCDPSTASLNISQPYTPTQSRHILVFILRLPSACVIIKPMEINILFDIGFEDCLPEDWLRTIAASALSYEGKTGIEMGILITGQEKIQELNNLYLQEDHPTDVLSFAMLETTGAEPVIFPGAPDKLEHLGEVIISYPQAAIQAAEHHHPVKAETALLLVHGILHLLGYDHDIPEREDQMKKREQEILKLVPGREPH